MPKEEKKTLTIGMKAGLALNGSIRKWERIVKAFEDNPDNPSYSERGVEDCSLCVRYAEANDCGRCPIKIDSGECCRGTPYGQWARHERNNNNNKKALVAAKQMRNYLLDLRGRCTVIRLVN